LGTTTSGYSLVRSGKMPMKLHFGQILALGHNLDTPSYRRFMDHDRGFIDKSLVERFPSQCSAYHQRFIN
ncbi:hypothetical protein HAX54_002785, partial [Datura stramonium]|nr:hypothetical protein [Datura stramonium]